MTKKSRIISIITCIIMLLTMTSGLVYADDTITQADINEGLYNCRQYPVSLTLDGTTVKIDGGGEPPVIIKERTLIPARALFEGMGGVVTWDNDNQKVGVYLNGKEVSLTIGSNIAFVDGAAKTLEVPAMIIDSDGDYFGSTMIPVRFTAEALGCTVGWDNDARSVLVTAPKAVVTEPATGDNKNDDNNDNNNTDTPVTYDKSDDNDNSGTVVGSGTLPASDLFSAYELTPLPMLTANAQSKLIVIDPGHGGKDSGSIGHEDMSDELYEKKVNLPVGLKLNAWLQKSGATTYMTRSTDTYLTLLERAAIANDRKATFFVSVHNNSSDYTTPHGTEVLYYSKLNADGRSETELYGIDSKSVAAEAENEITKALGTYKRGTKSSPEMAVLNKTTMPAIIVEGSFLSYEEEFQKMNLKTDEYAERYAYSLAKAIINKFNEAFPD